MDCRTDNGFLDQPGFHIVQYITVNDGLVASISSPSTPNIRPQVSRFSTLRLSDEGIAEVDSYVQTLFCSQDLLRGDNIIPSSAGGHQGRYRYKGSGSCRPPASAFRLGRWERDRKSTRNSASWYKEIVRQRSTIAVAKAWMDV